MKRARGMGHVAESSQLRRCFKFILLYTISGSSGVPKVLCGGVYGGEGVCL